MLTTTSEPLKRCSCGETYEPETWAELPLVGYQPDGDGGALELRNCDTCCSTLAIEAVS